MSALFQMPWAVEYQNIGTGVTPGAGYKLNFYAVGTSTRKNTYTSAAYSTAHANPVVADANGRWAPIYLLGAYKVVYTDANDVVLKTIDEYTAPGGSSGATVQNLAELKTITGTAGDSVRTLGYYAPGDGGHGEYYWSAASTATPNNGSVVQPDSLPASGRWILIPENGLYNPKQFGCVGDKSADDTTRMQAIFDADVPIFGDGEGLYKITSSIYINNSTIKITGKLKLRPSGAITALRTGSVTQTCSTTLSVNTRAGRNSITVASSSGMQVGDIIVIIATDVTWPYDAINYPTSHPGETNRIKSISGNVIYLADLNWLSYNAGANTTVKTYSPRKLEIEGLDIVYDTPQSIGAVSLFGCAESIYSFWLINGSKVGGLFLDTTHGDQVIGCRILNCNETGLGYGIQTEGCTNVNVNSSFFYNNRRGVDFSGAYPSHNCSVSGSVSIGITDEGSGFGTHATANRCSFIGNKVSNSLLGFQIRSPNTLIDSNDIFVSSTGILNAGGPGIVVTNNTMFMEALSNQAVDSANGYFYQLSSIVGESNDVYLLGESAPAVIKNNSATVTTSFMYISVSSLQSYNISNNTISIKSNSSGNPTSFIESASSSTINNSCQIFNNEIRSITGTFIKYRNVVLSSPMCDPVDLSYITQIGASYGIQKYSGAGTLSGITYNSGFYQRDPTGRRIRLSANVTFTVNAAAVVVIWSGFSGGQVSQQTVYKANNGSGTARAVGFVASNSDNFFIGNDAADPTVAFGVGTHTVWLDIEFDYRYNSNY